MIRSKSLLSIVLLTILFAVSAFAQEEVTGPWRGVGIGPLPPPTPRVVAIRAGRLFDSLNGKMLTKQVILLRGDKISEVGPEDQVKIPAGTPVIDLSNATVLPGLMDAHTHMFDVLTPKMTHETSVLLALYNAQTDLKAGFTAARDMSTHGNGYSDIDVRDAINHGYVDGPRYQVSTRGIADGTRMKPGVVPAPGASAVVRTPEEGREAVRDQIQHGADWIKLFPTGAYSFSPTGELMVEPTYSLEELQAIIDEVHKLGHKAGCHAYGGEGLKNAIIAGCDTIEHGQGLTREEIDMMVQKGLYYNPTGMRYTEPKIADADKKNTDGKYSIIPIFEKNAEMAFKTKGLKVLFGSGVDDGTDYLHGTQGLDFEWDVKHGLSPVRTLQAATIVDAEMLGWKDKAGSITKGKFADIVAVPGDPLQDMKVMTHVMFVMKGGKIIKNDWAPGEKAGPK